MNEEKILEKISKGREYRSMQMDTIEDGDKKVVEGYATTFSQPYDLYSFDDENG